MTTRTRYQTTMAGAAMFALLFSLSAKADDTTSNDDAIDNAPMVLHLGKLSITGQQKIIDTLLAIKAALHQPLSNDPADAGKVVCRINKQTGGALEYLDCATNRDLSARHEYTQEQMLARRNGLPPGEYGEATQQDFDGLIASQPNHRLHVSVNGAALQAVLNSLPDDAKVVPQEGQG